MRDNRENNNSPQPNIVELVNAPQNEIMNNAITKIRTFKEEGYISILNYPPGGIELFSSSFL